MCIRDRWSSAVLALVTVVGALALIVARLLASRVPRIGSVGRWFTRHRTSWTAAVAGVATLGSLYFSEIADYVPCRLCWFQRIAMYPIALVAVIALVRRDRDARWYMVPMAAIGLVIATYHFLIERGVLQDNEACSLFGPPCSAVWYEEFGFVTMAFSALAAFAFVIVVNTLSFPREELS